MRAMLFLEKEKKELIQSSDVSLLPVWAMQKVKFFGLKLWQTVTI